MMLCKAQQCCRIIIINSKTHNHLAQELNLRLQNSKNLSNKLPEFVLLLRRRQKHRVNIHGPLIRILKLLSPLKKEHQKNKASMLIITTIQWRTHLQVNIIELRAHMMSMGQILTTIYHLHLLCSKIRRNGQNNRKRKSNRQMLRKNPTKRNNYCNNWMRLGIQEETNIKLLKEYLNNGIRLYELRILKHKELNYILNVSTLIVEVYSKKAVISEITLENILA